ncbi:MAG: hypothetical protein ACRD63_17620 [Pyrinomonadaceae bacterium]
MSYTDYVCAVLFAVARPLESPDMVAIRNCFESHAPVSFAVKRIRGEQ